MPTSRPFLIENGLTCSDVMRAGLQALVFSLLWQEVETVNTDPADNQI